MNNIKLGEFLNNNYLKALEYNKEKEGVKLLLLEFLDYSNSDLIINKDRILTNEEVNTLQKMIDRYLISNIPPQYILGYTYFYSLKIKVNENVLIPRFDTEVLVEVALKYLKGNEKIVDIGTGSGAISLALKKNMSTLDISGVDISNSAIDVSKENAKDLGLDIKFFKNDLLEGLGKYDVIISNPPYISYNDKISELVYQNEPHLALFASENGLYFYRKILEQAKDHLKETGKIFFEIGYNQKDDVIRLARSILKDKQVECFKDYGNRDRVIYIH